jgi:uncharacterized membrane protein (UPF0127 family)
MKNKAVLILSLFLLFCSGRAQRNKFIRVYFPDGFFVTAELAVTDEERQQGLMFREKINEDQAMLFIFEDEGIYSFWMKNMRFPIDILWLDGQKRIVHIEAEVPPCRSDPCPSYDPGVEALYVLELRSGCAARHGLKLYDRLNFILPKSVS